MPVTNRGIAQLKPGTTATTTRNYFNGLPPSIAIFQTGLAVFALLVIFRYCVFRLYAWLRTPGAGNPDSTQASALLGHGGEDCLPTWTMNEKDFMQHKAEGPPVRHDGLSQGQSGRPRSTGLAIVPNWTASSGDFAPPRIMPRPPPAPPLTPPELSSFVFAFDERPHDEDSFLHQPNPDYMSSTSVSHPGSSSTPATARRRSYNKTMAMDMPSPKSSSTDSGPMDRHFPPNSFPPSSPMLPPAPPHTAPKKVDVQGEVISVVDSDGAGWTRHTRVYGGGVCLACAASGGDHGGFYGATVRPEEMRGGPFHGQPTILS